MFDILLSENDGTGPPTDGLVSWEEKEDGRVDFGNGEGDEDIDRNTIDD